MDRFEVAGLMTLVSAATAAVIKGTDFVLAKRKGMRRDSMDEAYEVIATVKKESEERDQRHREDMAALRQENEECRRREAEARKLITTLQSTVAGMEYHLEWVDRKMKLTDPAHVTFLEMEALKTKSKTHPALPPGPPTGDPK